MAKDSFCIPWANLCILEIEIEMTIITLVGYFERVIILDSVFRNYIPNCEIIGFDDKWNNQ